MRQHVFKKGDAEFGMVDGRPTIRGECDLSSAADIEAWLNSFGDAPIDIDLSGVTFFGAAALRVLIAVAKLNPNIRVVEPSAVVRRVLEITDTTCYLMDGINPNDC
jgi:anti-anti-sigma factor